MNSVYIILLIIITIVLAIFGSRRGRRPSLYRRWKDGGLPSKEKPRPNTDEGLYISSLDRGLARKMAKKVPTEAEKAKLREEWAQQKEARKREEREAFNNKASIRKFDK